MMFKTLSFIAAMSLASSSLFAQSLDCAALANSTDAEPVGYAEQCGPFDTTPSGNATAAPSDMGSLIDFRTASGPANSLFSFTLNNLPGLTAVGVGNPSIFAMDYDATGTTLYGIPGSAAAANPNTLGTINTATAAFTPIAVMTGAPSANGLTIDPSTGDAYVNTGTDLFRIDLTTAVATPIGPFGGGATVMVDIAMNCNGEMYGHDIGTDSLYSINPATGAATLIGAHGLAANFAQGMDFDNDDGSLYAFIYTGGGTNTYGTFNLATGAINALFTNNPLGEFEGAIPTVCPGGAADLGVTKTNGVAASVPGTDTSYTVVASNAGPAASVGATVSDTFPAACASVSWTCVAAGGATCTAGPSAGNISDVIDLPVGGTATYTAVCSISAAATGTLDNTATITEPMGAIDPDPSNNSATDSDTLGASADVSITKTAAAPTPIVVGSTITYALTASNAGPSDAAGVVVTDTLPALVTYVSNTCGATVTGSTVTWNIGTLGNGATANCSISATVNGFGTISNTASVASTSNDPTPGNNASTASSFGAQRPFMPIPTLGLWAMLLLGLTFTGVAVVLFRNR